MEWNVTFYAETNHTKMPGCVRRSVVDISNDSYAIHWQNSKLYIRMLHSTFILCTHGEYANVGTPLKHKQKPHVVCAHRLRRRRRRRARARRS